MNQLAIVIPAYKSQYLKETLDCFANQTNKNFTIYIGDDNSPNKLEEIIAPYHQVLHIKYARFSDNIGSKHIVNQWERCIGLTDSEEWIWLFSDDDLVDPNAVDAFYRTMNDTKCLHDIYSFNTCVINRTGGLISEAPEVPDFETSEQMACNLLLGQRANCMPDHIFSRRIYQKNRGFVKTYYGQGSDWANSILFSHDNGFRVIPDAYVHWRYSGDNITSIAFRHKSEMIKGHFQFIDWVLDHFRYLLVTDPSGERYSTIKDAALYNLMKVIKDHYQGIPLSKLLYFAYFVRKRFQVPIGRLIADMLEYNSITLDLKKRIKRH